MAESCVEVQTLRKGDGLTFPKPGDKLYTHYLARLSSDEEIDSSYERRIPFRPRIRALFRTSRLLVKSKGINIDQISSVFLRKKGNNQ